MSVDRATWLLHAELDGELGPADRAELESLLESQPELHQERLELARLAQVIARVPELDPPPGLAARIASQVSLPAPQRPRRTFSDWFQPRNALPFATFAAGIAVAAGAFWILQFEPLPGDNGELVGSILREPTRVQLQLQDQLRQVAPRIDGEVTMVTPPSGGRRFLEFELNSSTPVDISIDLAASGLDFEGFAQREAGVDLLSTSAGRVSLRSQGEHQFTVFLRAADEGEGSTASPIGVSISAGEERLFQGAIEAP